MQETMMISLMSITQTKLQNLELMLKFIQDILKDLCHKEKMINMREFNNWNNHFFGKMLPIMMIWLMFTIQIKLLSQELMLNKIQLEHQDGKLEIINQIGLFKVKVIPDLLLNKQQKKLDLELLMHHMITAHH